MQKNVIIGTHHKAGTVWMSSVFKAIAAELGVRYIDYWETNGDVDLAADERFILFNYHSAFPENADALDRKDVRILHLIRDPRDVLISALKFHLRSNEAWLHELSGEYGGKSYQQVLKDMSSNYHRYVFEMEHSTKVTIGRMLDWNYDRANSFEARYGDLIVDVDLRLWDEITSFLGFEEHEKDACQQCFWKYSLFGGLAGSDHADVRSHVQSGREGQWKVEFDHDIAQAFLKRFPDALQRLGYETDSIWIDSLGDGAVPDELPLHMHHAQLNATRQALLACYGRGFGDRPDERIVEIRERKTLQGQLVADRLRLEPSDIVMDLGCGFGFMAHAIAPRVFRLYCVDINPSFIEFCRKELETVANVECMGIECLDFSAVGDVQFTKAYSTALWILFNYYDLHAHLRAMRKLLVVGGELYFEYADPEGVPDGDGAIFDAHCAAFLNNRSAIGDLVQYNGFSAIRAALAATGFALIERWQLHAETYAVLARKLQS